MRIRLGMVLLAGLTACARGAPAPLTPVAADAAEAAARPEAPAAPVAQAPVAPAVPAAPAAPMSPAEGAAVAPVAPARARASVPRAAAATVDTLREQAFLDSLRQLAPDSTAAPTVEVSREDVRSEAAALLGRPAGEAAAATWDIDVATYAEHERVQYWMGFFTGRARWHYARYLERAGRYDSMIRTRLGAAGLPQDMIYLAMIESGFNQTARSRAGAMGLWQFMPETGRRYGLAVDAWVDERRDPYRATDAAIRFLSELNDRFGSLWLAAAAYNSGPGKIRRGLARGDYGALNGDQAYFAMAEGTFLRRETRDYVPKLIAAALLGKEPARYGFTDLAMWSPLVYDSVPVAFAVGLDVVARLSGASRDDIEEMNPHLFRGVTPPDRRVWLRVPVGTADTVAARLATLPASERVTLLYHTVSRGETLSGVARRYGVTVADIRSANHLRSTRLKVGQRLVVPTSGRAVRRTTTAPSRPAATGATTRRAARAARPASAAAGSSARAGTSAVRRMHVVRQGETLWSISQSFGVSLDDLLRTNNLTRRSVLRVGQTVRLPN